MVGDGSAPMRRAPSSPFEGFRLFQPAFWRKVITVLFNLDAQRQRIESLRVAISAGQASGATPSPADFPVLASHEIRQAEQLGQRTSADGLGAATELLTAWTLAGDLKARLSALAKISEQPVLLSVILRDAVAAALQGDGDPRLDPSAARELVTPEELLLRGMLFIEVADCVTDARQEESRGFPASETR